jgi:hypothetical protein
MQIFVKTVGSPLEPLILRCPHSPLAHDGEKQRGRENVRSLAEEQEVDIVSFRQ